MQRAQRLARQVLRRLFSESVACGGHRDLGSERAVCLPARFGGAVSFVPPVDRPNAWGGFQQCVVDALYVWDGRGVSREEVSLETASRLEAACGLGTLRDSVSILVIFPALKRWAKLGRPS